MTTGWPALPYEAWRATQEKLTSHPQVLGKRAVELAPPEPQLQHAALRLTARGWETLPLPAPDRSGSMVVVLDLRVHEAVGAHGAGPRPGRRGADRPEAAGGPVAGAAGRGRGARALRPRPGRRLPRRGDDGG